MTEYITKHCEACPKAPIGAVTHALQSPGGNTYGICAKCARTWRNPKWTIRALVTTPDAESEAWDD